MMVDVVAPASVGAVVGSPRMAVTESDRLFVRVRANRAFNVVFNARLLLKSGVVVPLQRTLPTTSDTVFQSLTISLFDGWLIQCSCSAVETDWQYGQLFAQFWLQRGSVFSASEALMLAGGYLTSGAALFWPFGRFEDALQGRGTHSNSAEASPAVGAQFSTAESAAQADQIESVFFTLTTSAVVATRQMYVELLQLGIVVARLPANGTQLASLARTYVGCFNFPAPAATGSFIFFTLPLFWLNGSPGWRTAADNFDAGDAITAVRWSRERLLAVWV